MGEDAPGGAAVEMMPILGRMPLRGRFSPAFSIEGSAWAAGLGPLLSELLLARCWKLVLCEPLLACSAGSAMSPATVIFPERFRCGEVVSLVAGAVEGLLKQISKLALGEVGSSSLIDVSESSGYEGSQLVCCAIACRKAPDCS